MRLTSARCYSLVFFALCLAANAVGARAQGGGSLGAPLPSSGKPKPTSKPPAPTTKAKPAATRPRPPAATTTTVITPPRPATTTTTTTPPPRVSNPGSTARTFRNARSGIELIYVPAGDFMMGSSAADIQRTIALTRRDYAAADLNEWFKPEQPQHLVTIIYGFFLSRYEVTQAQWRAVMGTNPSSFKNCDTCPVEQVSWNDAQEFIKRLNAVNDGYVYRLPTEAEWEYAARAGASGDYAGNLDNLGWTYANAGNVYLSGGRDDDRIKSNNNRLHPVGQKQPNAFGLYDMHGNVWEWVEDIFNATYNGVPKDGSANLRTGDATKRVMRGGSFDFGAPHARPAYRYAYAPTLRANSVGFRLAASLR